jgi:hypothetical protein
LPDGRRRKRRKRRIMMMMMMMMMIMMMMLMMMVGRDPAPAGGPLRFFIARADDHLPPPRGNHSKNGYESA